MEEPLDEGRSRLAAVVLEAEEEDELVERPVGTERALDQGHTGL